MGFLYYPTLAGEIYTSEKLWKGKLRPTGETKPQNEFTCTLFCWPATNSLWHVSLIANCRAGSRHRPFCNNSIGEDLLLLLTKHRGGGVCSLLETLYSPSPKISMSILEPRSQHAYFGTQSVLTYKHIGYA